MEKLKLNFACGPYDRMEPLASGDVQPSGIDLTVTSFERPRGLFDRLMAGDEFDLAEMSSSEHIAMTCAGSNPFVALPVFPSKVFRHGFIVVNRRSGIAVPRDLKGMRIGVPLYTMSAVLWTMGMLEDEYGVDLSGVTWVQGAMEKPGAHGDPHPPALLKPAKIEINRSSYSLSELLARNEIDATLGALMPDGFGINEDLVRLFPDFREVEKDYFRRTRIHPIMHLVVIRRSIYERNSWIAKSLFKAFEDAKALAWERITYTGAQKYMLPWLYGDLDEIRDLCGGGGDPWPYGLEANRATLIKAVEYMHRYHLIARKPALEELFLDVAA